MFHPDNGLPILSWYNERDDEELYKITPLLEFLSKVNDVRKFIPKMVSNKEIAYDLAQNVIDSYNAQHIKKRKIVNEEISNDSQNISKALNKSNSGTSGKLKKSFDNNNNNDNTNSNNNIFAKEKDYNVKIISSSKQPTTSKNVSSKNRNAFRNGNISNIIKDFNINNSRSGKQNTNNNKHRQNHKNANNNNSISNNNNSNLNNNDDTFTMYKPIEQQQLKMVSQFANIKNKAPSIQPVTSNSTVISSTKHRPSTSSTSFTSNHHHKREISLNVGKDKKFILNPIYRSPSSQAIVISSSSTTSHKNNNLKISLNKQTPTNAKYNSNFNIHSISLYSAKNGMFNRPKSSEHGNLSIQPQLQAFVPKTPKLQANQNKLLKNAYQIQYKQGVNGGNANYEGNGNKKFVPMEEVFMKKRFSNTSRHIDNPNKINLIHNPWMAVAAGNMKKG